MWVRRSLLLMGAAAAWPRVMGEDWWVLGMGASLDRRYRVGLGGLGLLGRRWGAMRCEVERGLVVCCVCYTDFL